MFVAPIATLVELKARLGIATADTGDDAVLTELVLGISAAIENIAGHPLRRGHCLRERFAGGSSRIRLSREPVAQVHWVRESYDYDFDDPDAYDELEEGTDYALDAGNQGERPGESGWLRKLGGDFIGSEEEPGMVEVSYTGGYKTAGETALENSSLTINGTTNATLMDLFSVAARYNGSTLDGYLAQFLAATTAKAGVEYASPVSRVNRAFLVFNPGNVLLPTWEIVEATLALKLWRSDGSSALAQEVHLLDVNPRRYLRQLDELFALLDTPADAEALLLNQASTAAEATPDTVTITIHSDAAYNCAGNMQRLNQLLRQGFLAFGFRNHTEVLGAAVAGGWITPRHATTGNRPSLTLVHRDPIMDEWTMPDDLRGATLIQAIEDWQTRRWPGVRQETQRGVAISSGVSYMRDPSTMLPQVLAVAQHYARLL